MKLSIFAGFLCVAFIGAARPAFAESALTVNELGETTRVSTEEEDILSAAGSEDDVEAMLEVLSDEDFERLEKEVEGQVTAPPADLPDKLVLKNGMSVNCEVEKVDDTGAWVHTGHGVTMYFRTEEIKELQRGTAKTGVAR